MAPPVLPRPQQPEADPRSFDTAIRGYDKQQVDHRITSLTSELAAVTHARQQAEQLAKRTADDLRNTRSQLDRGRQADDSKAEEGFGFRVEKVLRMAEQEAADIRANAAREAAALVEKARAEAEGHRHDVEQSLISRAAAMDQEAAHRRVELQEREQQIADQLASARNEAEEVMGVAQRDATQLRQDAEKQAEELRQRSEKLARQRQASAEHELRRLNGLQGGVREELGRLQKLLVAELGSVDSGQDQREKVSQAS